MKRVLARTTAILGLLAATAAQADLAPEQVSVLPLAPADANRIYLSDLSISHFPDGKLHVIDGSNLKYLGLISTGLAGQSTLSPDRSEIYVATTYFPKLNRGVRGDEVDVYDAKTLKLKAEIPIPPKHAQALPYKGTIATTSDGRFILVQNATPATSVSVVDRVAGKFVAEITTPGCWIIVPYKSDARRFATLCGDGALLTITLDEAGQPVARKRSQPFFDPDEDPLFVQTVNDGDRHYFVSFKGRVHSVDLTGQEPVFPPTWNLASLREQQQGWRPGGYQPLGIHASSGRLYVGVHPKGHEGSHKEPAREIWAYDLKTRKRIQRAPGNAAIALAVSQADSTPRLFVYDGLKSAIVAYDALPRLAQRGRLAAVGESPTLMELQ